MTTRRGVTAGEIVCWMKHNREASVSSCPRLPGGLHSRSKWSLITNGVNFGKFIVGTKRSPTLVVIPNLAVPALASRPPLQSDIQCTSKRSTAKKSERLGFDLPLSDARSKPNQHQLQLLAQPTKGFGSRRRRYTRSSRALSFVQAQVPLGIRSRRTQPSAQVLRVNPPALTVDSSAPNQCRTQMRTSRFPVQTPARSPRARKTRRLEQTATAEKNRLTVPNRLVRSRIQASLQVKGLDGIVSRHDVVETRLSVV